MRNRIIIIGLLLIGFSGCKEIEKLTQFTMGYDSQVTIPANTVINLPVSFSTPDISTNAQSTFESKNTNAASVDEIKLQSMTLTIITPAGNNFNFFKSIEVFINTEGLPEVALGFDTDVADGITTLNLTTSEENIKNYVTAEKFTIRIATTTDEAITEEHQLNINTIYLVDAKVLGQ